MSPNPEIAIVEPNTLACLGLKGILEEIIPMATIRIFPRFCDLTDDTPDMYAHYFVAAQVYVEHNAFFLPRRRKTIVLAGNSPQFPLSGVAVLNIYEPEPCLIKQQILCQFHCRREMQKKSKPAFCTKYYKKTLRLSLQTRESDAVK